LGGNSKFFGSGTAEIISTSATTGGWGEDNAFSTNAGNSWSRLGGHSNDGLGAGIFAFRDASGNVLDGISHRTILSGY
jgi:hypothetical protein